MNMKCWWDCNEMRKVKYLEEKSECHFVYHKYHMEWLVIKPSPLL